MRFHRVDDRVELGVDPLDRIEGGGDKLVRRDLTLPHQRRQTQAVVL